MSQFKHLLYSIPFYILGFVSFFIFAPLFSGANNSDTAVQIIMAEGFHFPEELYYLGQDRLGSLIPLLAHLLYVVFSIKTITAVSIVQYLAISITFYLLQKRLSSWLSKFLLCCVIFIPFPIMLLQVYVGHPYAPQFLLFAIVISLVYLLKTRPGLSLVGRTTIYLVISILCIMSIWVSEVSAFFVFSIIIARTYTLFRSVNFSDQKMNIEVKFNVFHFIISSVLFVLTMYYGLKLIIYIKSFCYKQPGIETWFTDYKTFANQLDNFWLYFRNSFEFRIKNTFISLHNLILLLLTVGIVFSKTRDYFKYKKAPARLPFFFLLNALLGFFFLMYSNWVVLNDYDYRYFIYPYIFLTLFIITSVDTLNQKIRPYFQFLYLIGIISYAILTFKSQTEYYRRDARNFSLKEVSEFKQLSNSGIIGDYWFSYVLAMNSDLNIKATAHEFNYIRSQRLYDSVLMKKDIYLIKNRWLSYFNDTIKQFDLDLIRNGSPQNIRNVEFCKYRLADVHLTYYPKNPEANGTLTTKKAEASATAYTDSLKQYNSEYVIYGPFKKFLPGKFRVSYLLEFSETFNQNGSIVCDVSANWGGIILGSTTIGFNNQKVGKSRTVEVELQNPEIKSLVEYRIKLTGSLAFRCVEIKIDRIP